MLCFLGMCKYCALSLYRMVQEIKSGTMMSRRLWKLHAHCKQSQLLHPLISESVDGSPMMIHIGAIIDPLP
jgi:hypothetical protein